MRQDRTVQATIFEVFARHEIGCELKAISQWLDRQRLLVGLVASDLRRRGLQEAGRRGLPAEAVLRCALSSKTGNWATRSWPFTSRIRHRLGPLPGCRGTRRWFEFYRYLPNRSSATAMEITRAQESTEHPAITRMDIQIARRFSEPTFEVGRSRRSSVR
jgi:hypothetical protein